MGANCGWFPMDHDEILAWIEAHKESLPKTLAELSAFPIPFRKAIVAFVPPETRLRFWREHLESFIASGALTADQHAFVQETSEQLSTLLAAPGPNPRLIAWEARATKLFSRPEAASIFGNVGPPEPPDGLPLPPDAKPRSAV
jgi:hypothetical protein